ncbi:MAG TPA: hydrolase [Syntrophales bacterium]|nr:hydrolase [Syntrophales bacterium]HPN25404.1 hydrolase [Syntrophales bacterium]HQM29886.1 hydrolase [Syntrophales bacterium]
MLSAEQSLLFVIDVQGNLYESMHDKLFLLENLKKLIPGVMVFGVPVILTEQIKIGATIPEIAGLMSGVQPFTKGEFSCLGNEKIMDHLKGLKKRQVIVSGIETHVCVYQTVMDLLERGYEVHLVADAVSSRTRGNREIALERMVQEGAKLTSTEIVLFELAKTAEDPRFRDIFKIVK